MLPLPIVFLPFRLDDGTMKAKVSIKSTPRHGVLGPRSRSAAWYRVARPWQQSIDFLALYRCCQSQFSKQQWLIRRPRAAHIDFSEEKANSDEKMANRDISCRGAVEA